MMDREYHRDYSRNYYHKRMSEIKSSLGGKCIKCGSKDNLELHHTDPQKKRYAITKKVLSVRKDDLKKEIEKCVLLCHDCHKLISDKQLSDTMKAKPISVVTIRAVKCKEDNLRFDSISECAKHYSVNIRSIQRVLSGDRKAWHNKHFVYDGEKRTVAKHR